MQPETNTNGADRGDDQKILLVLDGAEKEGGVDKDGYRAITDQRLYSKFDQKGNNPNLLNTHDGQQQNGNKEMTNGIIMNPNASDLKKKEDSN